MILRQICVSWWTKSLLVVFSQGSEEYLNHRRWSKNLCVLGNYLQKDFASIMCQLEDSFSTGLFFRGTEKYLNHRRLYKNIPVSDSYTCKRILRQLCVSLGTSSLLVAFSRSSEEYLNHRRRSKNLCVLERHLQKETIMCQQEDPFSISCFFLGVLKNTLNIEDDPKKSVS